MKILKQFLWILPFLCFLLGYFFISQIIAIKTIASPALLGKSVEEALKEVSHLNLNLRIIAEKEDEELPPNIIINQIPQAGYAIKSNQVLLCVISKKPAMCTMPSFVDRSINELIDFAKEHLIAYKIYHIPSKYPSDKIIAHVPQAQRIISKSGIIAYVSAPERKQIIVPNFTNKTVADVKDLLAETQINIVTHHHETELDSHECQDCIIFDQRPLAGTLVFADQPLNLILSVAFKKRYF